MHSHTLLGSVYLLLFYMYAFPSTTWEQVRENMCIITYAKKNKKTPRIARPS